MKARSFQTQFWTDDTVHKLSTNSKLLWAYLITNPHLGMTCYVRIPDAYICEDTGLSPKDLKECKAEIEATNKILFYENWIFIRNLEKYNNYNTSPKNKVVYERELSSIPNHIKDYFKDKDTHIDSGIDTSIDSNEKLEIRNKKLEIRNKEVEKKISTISLFKENQSEILAKAKELYPSKNCDRAIEDYLGYIESRNTKYKDFKLAFFNWVREDRFNKYENKGIRANGSVAGDRSKYGGL